ncbi:speckle-type poz [Fusarium sp. NRRL 25303]|nr:speckle-type poz [Fusarium sp. NRRL 25303]
MALNGTQEQGNGLLLCLKQLFEDGAYSDLTIACGDDYHKVHKAIICPRSKFFASACNIPFQEGQSGVVHLPEDDPFAIKAMLYYLYHLDYPLMAAPVVDVDEADMARPFTFRCTYQPSALTVIDPAAGTVHTPLSKKAKKIKKKEELRCQAQPPQGPQSVPPIPNLCLHAKVYALGEKYGIEDLKRLALDKFDAEAKHHWQSDDFLHAIREVYRSTMDEDHHLRDVVVEVVYAHMELLDQSRWQESIKDLGLCFDLLMRSRRR